MTQVSNQPVLNLADPKSIEGSFRHELSTDPNIGDGAGYDFDLNRVTSGSLLAPGSSDSGTEQPVDKGTIMKRLEKLAQRLGIESTSPKTQSESRDKRGCPQPTTIGIETKFNLDQ